MHRFISRFVAIALLFTSAACNSQGPGSGGNEPTITSFQAEPATIAPGETSTLSWEVSGATSLSLEPGIGEVEGSSIAVTPSQTTQYTLTATNANGEDTATTTVTVRSSGGGEPEPLHDTIAYATGNGDEIRLVNPDGSSDRSLWAHGLDDPSEVYEVWSLTWKPDATELAFSSTHENWCSLNNADIFAIGSGGEDYRRVTESPSCAELAAYPKGTVRVPVENVSIDSFFGFIYFQGAPSVQQVSLAPGGSSVVTFTEVADFGADYLQIAALINPPNRNIDVGAAVNVQAGGTVTAPAMSVYNPDTFWEAFSPTWRRDGSSIGYAFNFNSPMQLSPNPEPLEFGSPILAQGADLPDFILQLAWGPTEATASQLLFQGSETFDSVSIYLATEGSATLGEPLVSYPFTEFIYGLAWLPDGSSFVFSVTDGNFGGDKSSNLFIYDLATEETTRVTTLSGDFAGQVSVSSDGERFVFERAAELDEFGSALLEPDLWIVNQDGSGLRLLVEDAYAPAWSW